LTPVLDIGLVQRRQRWISGKTGINTHTHLGASLTKAFYQLGNPAIGLQSRSDVAFTQQAADQIACFGDGCNQW